MGRAALGYFEDEDNFEILQYLLYSLNSIFFVGAAMIFSLGMFIRFDEDMVDYMTAVELYFYWDGCTVIIIASSLVMINAFVGCCATFFAHKKVIIYYVITSGITFVMLLGGSAYLLQHGLQDSDLLFYISQKMHDLIQLYQTDVGSKRRVDMIQEYIGCCGGFGYSDYMNIHLPIPNTCRSHVTGNQYTNNCGVEMSSWMERKTGWICGVSLVLSFLELFSVVVSVYAYMFIQRIEKTL